MRFIKKNHFIEQIQFLSNSISIYTLDCQNKHKILEVPVGNEVNSINGPVLNDFGLGVKKRTKWHIRINNRTGKENYYQ